MRVVVGPMTKRVMKSATPTSTWLGGACCAPTPVRTKPSTTMIRVKLVIVSAIAGSSESTVSSARTRS